jgi:hypothetical protein
MAQSRCLIMGCLFTLCTVVLARAQTTAPADISMPERGATSAFRATANLASAAQPLSPSPKADQQDALAGRFVNEKLAVWRHRLNLDDWRISIVMSRRSDLKPKTLGGTRWDKGKKSAEIWVLDPAGYKLPFREVLNDMELTIVHELVHLELASLPRSEASRSNEEHAVNRIAEALITLDRQE